MYITQKISCLPSIMQSFFFFEIFKRMTISVTSLLFATQSFKSHFASFVKFCTINNISFLTFTCRTQNDITTRKGRINRFNSFDKINLCILNRISKSNIWIFKFRNCIFDPFTVINSMGKNYILIIRYIIGNFD